MPEERGMVRCFAGHQLPKGSVAPVPPHYLLRVRILLRYQILTNTIDNHFTTFFPSLDLLPHAIWQYDCYLSTDHLLLKMAWSNMKALWRLDALWNSTAIPASWWQVDPLWLVAKPLATVRTLGSGPRDKRPNANELASTRVALSGAKCYLQSNSTILLVL